MTLECSKDMPSPISYNDHGIPLQVSFLREEHALLVDQNLLSIMVGSTVT